MHCFLNQPKYAENCSFYVVKVQRILHKIVTISAPNILDPMPCFVTKNYYIEEILKN